MPIAKNYSHKFFILLPSLLYILAALISLTPTKFVGLGYFFPLLDSLIIYYFYLYNPKLIPYLLVFIVGIIQDSLLGRVIGITSFSNLAAILFFLYKRDLFFGKDHFIEILKGFAIFLAIVAVIRLILLVFLQDDSGQILNINIFLQYFVTLCLYPLFHLILNFVHRLLPEHS